MRTLIFNANIITGDGKTFLENKSLVLNGEVIDGIMAVTHPTYAAADLAIDAEGGFVIPGIIDNHVHGITMAPFNDGNASPALPKSRVEQNQRRHLLQGSTTLVNTDGFATKEEMEEARCLTPMLLQTLTTHTPLYLKFAKILNLGGLEDKHWLNAEDRIKEGALGIGEGSGTSDTSYFILNYIPITVREKTGVQISMGEAEILYSAFFAGKPDKKAAQDLMARRDIFSATEDLKELANQCAQHVKFGTEATQEAAKLADKLGKPFYMQSSPGTKTQVLELVRELKSLLIACHCNFVYKPKEALEVARAVKKAQGWVDIHTGDFFGPRQFFPNHATTLALLAEGLADTISSDYIAGYWDSIPQVLKYAIEQKVIDLPTAIALATGNVKKAIPDVAPNRGQIAEGKIADLVILDRNDISKVRAVLIRGRVVVDEGRIVIQKSGSNAADIN